jgi:hypothetical protein
MGEEASGLITLVPPLPRPPPAPPDEPGLVESRALLQA